MDTPDELPNKQPKKLTYKFQPDNGLC